MPGGIPGAFIPGPGTFAPPGDPGAGDVPPDGAAGAPPPPPELQPHRLTATTTRAPVSENVLMRSFTRVLLVVPRARQEVVPADVAFAARPFERPALLYIAAGGSGFLLRIDESVDSPVGPAFRAGQFSLSLALISARWCLRLASGRTARASS